MFRCHRENNSIVNV